MAQHRVATPGGQDFVLDSPAELATALLERLGAIPSQRDGRSHRRSADQESTGAAGLLESLARPGARTSRPALAALSVTAVGAAVAVAATGGFTAITPSASSAALSLSAQQNAAVADAHPITGPLAATPPVATELPAMQVTAMVDQATSTGRALAAQAAAAPAAALAAAPAAAPAAAAPAHAPAPKPSPGPDTAGKASGAAGKALAAAMSVMGKPYVWGAAGPNAFDCSGLVQWAFGKAGIKVPRTSAAQSQVGTAVSRADLQPGDLVFFYTPVHHVGIYIGNGKVVNATQTGEPVQISNIAYMPIHNIRRLG